MTEAFPKLTIREMGEMLAVTRAVDAWGERGDMRRAFLGNPSPPRTPLERAALMAFDVAAQDEPRSAAGIVPDARSALVDRMSRALRLSLVEERATGEDGRTDVDRARSVLTSLGIVRAMEDRADGFDPDPLENRTLESMRSRSGIETSAFTRAEAHQVTMGMGDMVAGDLAREQLLGAFRVARTESADYLVEDRLRAADKAWPQVQPRDAGVVASPGRGPVTAEAAAPARPTGRER